MNIIWTLTLIATLGFPAALMGQEQKNPEMGRDVKVKQEPGKTVYWVLPGPRRLSERVFGVPGHPLHTGELKIKQAQGPVKDLFKRFPIMAGVPLKLRATNEEGTKFTKTKKPTPVGDKGKIVSGEFEITYKDRQPMDLPGDSTDTLDSVEPWPWRDSAAPHRPGWQPGGRASRWGPQAGPSADDPCRLSRTRRSRSSPGH